MEPHLYECLARRVDSPTARDREVGDDAACTVGLRTTVDNLF